MALAGSRPVSWLGHDHSPCHLITHPGGGPHGWLRWGAPTGQASQQQGEAADDGLRAAVMEFALCSQTQQIQSKAGFLCLLHSRRSAWTPPVFENQAFPLPSCCAHVSVEGSVPPRLPLAATASRTTRPHPNPQPRAPTSLPATLTPSTCVRGADRGPCRHQFRGQCPPGPSSSAPPLRPPWRLSSSSRGPCRCSWAHSSWRAPRRGP